MKTITELTRDEKKLLLFCECAAVDYGGVYDPARLNGDDREIIDRWKEEGFVDHGRVCAADVTPKRLVWLRLSPEAMGLAQELRRERAERMWKNRTWRTVADKRAAEQQESPVELA